MALPNSLRRSGWHRVFMLADRQERRVVRGNAHLEDRLDRQGREVRMHEHIGDRARPAPHIETNVRVHVGVGLVPSKHGQPPVRQAIAEQTNLLSHIRHERHRIPGGQVGRTFKGNLRRQVLGNRTLPVAGILIRHARERRRARRKLHHLCQ